MGVPNCKVNRRIGTRPDTDFWRRCLNNMANSARIMIAQPAFSGISVIVNLSGHCGLVRIPSIPQVICRESAPLEGENVGAKILFHQVVIIIVSLASIGIEKIGSPSIRETIRKKREKAATIRPCLKEYIGGIKAGIARFEAKVSGVQLLKPGEDPAVMLYFVDEAFDQMTLPV